ncbi:Kelch repeat-containing protein [Paraliomyxa miuraensis]|uniref:Kelch repeat-containing protein n=1 Tax=Paraliomyxa miuraensis TaxID=376150 RepID=UPI00225C3FA4|nr:hypothetical protein [Paraliomyxa miuraensis]MCX4241049.1 hypothetical protein [Paraliomyxa miuraensis]
MALASVTPRPLPRSVEGDLPMLPQALTSFGAALHGEHLYVYGGYFGRPHDYSEAGQSGALVRLSLATGTWEDLGSGPKLQSVALVTHGDALYRAGGMQAQNPAGQPADLRSQDGVARFDPSALRWTELPPLPEPRSSHDAIAVGDTLYVVGGWQLDGPGAPTWLDTAASRPLHDDAAEWSRFEAPFRRRAVAAAAAADRLVVVGGLDPEGSVSQAVDVYDPAGQAWTRGPDFPGAGFGVAAVGIDDTVYAGGSDGVIHRWRVGAPAWERETSMALPRFFHRFVATGPAELAVLGGIRSMATGTRVRPVERIAVGQHPRSPSVAHVELSNPAAARNRQGVFLLDDALYVFGGNVSLGQHDFEPQHFTDQGARLDLVTFEWSPMAPYPARRQTMSTLITSDGTALAVGGFGHDGEVARTHPELHVYEPVADRWTPRPGGLPGLGRTQLGLAEHDGTLWVLGGLDYDPRRSKDDQFRHERSVLHAPLHDPKAGLVPSGLELPRPRRAFASAQLGDRVYLVGGMREGFALVEECEVLDLSSGTWHALPGPARPRLSAELVALGGKLYLAGGSSRPAQGGELAADRSVEVFDPATGSWSTLIDALPIETRHMRMLPWRDRLLVYNAHDEDGRVHVLVIDPGDGPAAG